MHKKEGETARKKKEILGLEFQSQQGIDVARRQTLEAGLETKLRFDEAGI